jgi:alpha-mannosidase
MSKKLTIHVVSHAHIDPVWMWRKPEGIDEALATCRSARDRLLEYPEMTYIQGEAWIYEQIEKLDPELFASIGQLIEEGRWEIVGGWYMQPDCNFPTIESFRKQVETGQAFFRSRFGRVPSVGFNPDAFGHAATLPDLLNEYGYQYYVHMRPEEDKMALELPLYRWRGVGGKELMAFRVVQSYNGLTPGWLDAHVNDILKTDLRERVGHALCFIGCGDHGGGATGDLVEYVLRQRNAWPDTEVVFSTFGKFFEAAEPVREQLPVKEGELQYFAIGCYSVNREIKTSMRESEHALIRAESGLKQFGSVLSEEEKASERRHLDIMWKRVLFNQFHDILPGSLIHSGKIDAVRDLGGVLAYVQDLETTLTRRTGLAQPENPCQRLFLANFSDTPFDGIVEHTPWLKYEGFREVELRDEQGNAIAYQRADAEAYVGWYHKMVFPIQCQPGQLRVLTLHPAAHRAPNPIQEYEGISVTHHTLETDFWKIQLGATGVSQIWRKGADGALVPLLDRRGAVFEMAEDNRDTWAMIGPGHFLDEPLGVFSSAEPWVIEESGPIRATLCRTMRVGNSTLAWRVRLYTTSPRIEFDLKLSGQEQQKRFTLRLPFARAATSFTSGIPGGQLRRAPSIQEYPFQDWTLLEGASPEAGLSILSPDTFSFSVRERETHFTLLRAKPFGWVATAPDRVARMGEMQMTDQGEFRYRFVLQPALDTETLRRQARNLQQPPLAWDLTKGMLRHSEYLLYTPREDETLYEL